MPAALPIWPTTKAAISHTWERRTLAVRYAVVPVLLLILLDGIGTAFNIDIGEDQVWQFVAAIATLLAFAPLIVTWYVDIIVGTDEARRRPLFVIGRREITVALTTMLIELIAVATAFPLICVALLIGAGVAEVNQLSGQIVTVVGVIVAVAAAVIVFTCLSISVAAAALGRYLRIRDALKLTWPIAVRFTCIHVILGVIGLAIDEGITALVGAGLEATGLGGAEGERAPIPDLIVASTDTVFSVVYLLLATTLFGFIYRRLSEQSVENHP